MDEPKKDPIDLKQEVETVEALDSLGSESTVTEPVAPEVNPRVPESPKVDEIIPEAAVTPTEKKDVDDDSDEGFAQKLEAIQPKENDHPNKVDGMKALKQIANDERTARKELQKDNEAKNAEIERLNQELKGAKLLTPELEEKLKVADEMIRAIDIERDPEFQSKFKGKIKTLDEKASLIIQNSTLSDQIKKFIQDHGGPVAVASSNDPMPAAIGGSMSEWIVDTILPALPGLTRERMKSLLAEAVGVKEEMQLEIAKAKQEAPELQKKRADEMARVFGEARDRALQRFGDRATPWKIPENVTPERKAEIEMHNARLAKADAKFKEFLSSGNDPKAVATMMVSAAQSEYLMSWNEDLQKQIEELTADLAERDERIAKLKGSTPRAKESNAPVTPEAPLNKALSQIKDTEAIDAFLNA